MTKGNFLGFMVHEGGIEVDTSKAQAIIHAKPPTTKKELQQLVGKIHFLHSERESVQEVLFIARFGTCLGP